MVTTLTLNDVLLCFRFTLLKVRTHFFIEEELRKIEKELLVSDIHHYDKVSLKRAVRH